VSDEFLSGKAYSFEVIITNASTELKNFNVLYQIPQGSIPLLNTKYQHSYPLSINSFTTIRNNFYFYFPGEGSFAQFPTNVALEGAVVSRPA